MPTLGWKFITKPPPRTGTVTVMASRFELTKLSAVPAFFRASLRAWRQTRIAPGCIGASLQAHVFKKEFWTLSAWESQENISTYAATEPHASIMKTQTKHMKQSTFVFWKAEAATLPINWDDAKNRVWERLKKSQ